MTQTELNRAVAKATGESVETIVRMGFVALAPQAIEREPRVLDWDRHQDLYGVRMHPRRRRTPAPASV